MGYRSSLGMSTLLQRALEAAARRALATGACSYPSVKSIPEERSLDRQPLETPPRRTALEHANLLAQPLCAIGQG